MGAIMRGHKRYFLEYKSDKITCGTYDHEIGDYNKHLHDGGRGNSMKTMKGYIKRIRKEQAEYNPHDFRVYDVDADVPYDEPAPCIYRED